MQLPFFLTHTAFTVIMAALLTDKWKWIMGPLWKLTFHRHSLTSRNQNRPENSSSSVHLMLYSQPCWWDKICFIFFFRLCRSAYVLTRGFRSTKKVGESSLCLCGVLISRSLLMFGWSWQDFCIHNTLFREPQRTSSARLGWDQKWRWILGFSCGCTCSTDRQKNTHGRGETTLYIELRKCFQ